MDVGYRRSDGTWVVRTVCERCHCGNRDCLQVQAIVRPDLAKHDGKYFCEECFNKDRV